MQVGTSAPHDPNSAVRPGQRRLTRRHPLAGRCGRRPSAALRDISARHGLTALARSDPGEPGRTEEDWLASWLPEIERRAEEFDQDPTIGIPADEVFASIRAALGTRT